MRIKTYKRYNLLHYNMQYGIVYTKDNCSKIVKTVASHDEFRIYVQERNPEAKFLDYGTDRDIRKHGFFNNGLYLLEEDSTISLLNKYDEELPGFVYNSSKSRLETLATWSLLEYSNKGDISDYDIDRLTVNSGTCVFGKRGTGKTVFVINVLKHLISTGELKEEDISIVSLTEQYSQAYTPTFPKACVYHFFNENFLDDYMSMIKSGEKKTRFLVIDECLSSKGAWLKNNQFTDLLLNHRHYNLGILVTMQFPLGIKPEVRSNFNQVVLFAEDFISNKKRLYDHYCGFYENFNAFDNQFIECTDNFHCMVISATGDKVSKFKATI